MTIATGFETSDDFIRCMGALVPIVRDASAKVMEIYEDPKTIEVSYKGDSSPLTNADLAAHSSLCEGLTREFPGIPIVSEEASTAQNSVAVQSDIFWLIDPIDGTKEFIKHNGQFTVCVALIVSGKPVLGVVAAPALGELYYGGANIGSFVVQNNQTHKIHVADEPTNVVCGSISHPNAETAAYLAAQFPGADIQEYGSQLKFMRVAAGFADAYPRLGTTMRVWDIAAGHAIVEGAGGVVTRPDGSAINYARPDFLAGDFVALRKRVAD